MRLEFCDNLIFRRRAALDTLGERLLDDYGNGFGVSKSVENFPALRDALAQYVRDHLMLRTEAGSNNVRDYVLREERPRRRCIWQTGGRPNGTVRSILNSPRFAKTSGIQRLSAFSVSRAGRAPTLGGLVLLKARLVQICEVSKRDTLFPANREFHVRGASLSMSIAPQDLGHATA